MCFGIALGALVILSLVVAAHTARAQNPPAEKVIHNFRPATGYYPRGMTRDAAGNLYVATLNGGSNASCVRGCGNILKVSPSRVATELYAFISGTPKTSPAPFGPTLGAKGILYGVTAGGGHYKVGSVLELAPSGTEKTLHNFDPATGDGYYPSSGLTVDVTGNLYGATATGGGTIGCKGEAVASLTR
jgi:hypothetical protein